MSESIVGEEQELLSRVSTLLTEVPYISPPSEKDIVKELLRLREDLPNAKEEDRGALMAQYNQLLSLLQQLRDSRDKADVDPDCPYFAHLRLEENGRSRDLCLGKATRIQRGIRIIDWRNAPISKIFYRYQQGEEYEEELGDRLQTGTVSARRTVTIQRGRLVRIDAPEGTFQVDNDGVWSMRRREPPRLAGGEGASMQAHRTGEGQQRRLGTDLHGSRRRSDKRLPDIAGLIDPEQFELITRPSAGFVVIRGTAGSGKTTVALHRIAYLAYEDPSIDSDRTMFLVFSKALRDYVAHVLPALGTENVQVRTYKHWSAQQRKRHFPRLPKKIREHTPEVVVRLKLHPVMLRALELQAETDGDRTPEQAMDDWASVLTNLPRLLDLFARHAPESFTEAELRKATTWCRDRYEELVSWLETRESDVPIELDAEDDALLLRAWQLRMGPLRARKKNPLRYRHIAVDEVQDFSPIEVRVLLGCLDKRQSITLAGDTQQHVMKEAGFTSWSNFFAHLGVEGAEVNTLRIAYRSSRQIVSFAMSLLGDLAEDDTPPLTTRDGPPAEFFRFTDHGACVAFLADALKSLMRDEPLASVAVLTPDSATSALYHQGLDSGEVPYLRRVTSQDFSFGPGVEVTEVAQVKGLEFDYVILVEASARSYPDTPSARRVLHVGATRAVHQLWLTSVGTPSPILREAFEGTIPS